VIDNPVVGMKVNVVDRLHCNEYCPSDENHAGKGEIVKVSDRDSFLVQMDNLPDEKWWRCRKCVTAVVLGKKVPDEAYLTKSNKESWLGTIWLAIDGYRESLIPEGDSGYDKEYDDICTAMAWIREELGLPDLVDLEKECSDGS
jgi:hypothetical protein